MTTVVLEDFFERNGFIVHSYESDGIECAEIEMWTDGGVDMIINLNPLTKEEFIDYVEKYFDIDEEVKMHWEDKSYRDAFTITQSLKDFTKYHKYIKGIANKLKKLK